MPAEDRLEVMELIGRYQMCIDAGDEEAYAANFVPNGVVEAPSGLFNGREELKGMISDMVRRGRIGGDQPSSRHFISMPYVFGGNEQRCRARTYMLTIGCDENGELIADAHWTYVDDIVKYEGKWLFERRKFQLDFRSSRARVSTSAIT
jgi:hypothetical protein